ISLTRSSRSDTEYNVVLLDCLDIILLPKGSGDDRCLAWRSYNPGRNDISEIIRAFLIHRVESVIEFVFLNVDAALSGLLELMKDALSAIQLGRLTFQLNPTFTSGDLHSERIFQVLQQLQIVCVERLQCSRALKFQGSRFAHCAINEPVTNRQDRKSVV